VLLNPQTAELFRKTDAMPTFEVCSASTVSDGGFPPNQILTAQLVAPCATFRLSRQARLREFVYRRFSSSMFKKRAVAHAWMLLVNRPKSITGPRNKKQLTIPSSNSFVLAFLAQ
jgi:hypothetical protein